MELKRHYLYIWQIVRVMLLIVPYGIETAVIRIFCSVTPTFNRTLWNWNNNYTNIYYDYSALLIVPYGIETMELVHQQHSQSAFNRTLWNWNNRTIPTKGARYWLLIVPYGIETQLRLLSMGWSLYLLIVPYGIETLLLKQTSINIISLLIVPYGIETLQEILMDEDKGLLIVPYGIETLVLPKKVYWMPQTFNRTLWNWNLGILVVFKSAKDF